MDLFLCYESFLEKLDSLGLEYYLLGDFNCNLASAQYDLNTRRLCEISDLFGLQQLITEPTRITESSSTLIDLIYTNYVDRVALNKWLISNKLTLNSTKTEFMLIGSRQKLSTLSNPLKLSIDNVAIEHVSSVKSLGILIDGKHTLIIISLKKVASGIGAIKRIKPFVPPPTLHYIYTVYTMH